MNGTVGRLLLASTLLFAITASCTGVRHSRKLNMDFKSILDIVDSMPELDFLSKAVRATNLTTELSQPNLIATAFLPSNEAFEWFLDMGNATADNLLGLTDILRNLLRYHIVPGRSLSTSDLGTGIRLGTLLVNNSMITDSTGPRPGVMDAAKRTALVVNGDFSAGFSKVHIMDTVLVPYNTSRDSVEEVLVFRRKQSILLRALQHANLSHLIGRNGQEVTLFAPTNKAFATALAQWNLTQAQLFNQTGLLQFLLLSHIVPGASYSSEWTGGIGLPTLSNGTLQVVSMPGMRPSLIGVGRLNNATANITVSDIYARNSSVIHVIDRVLVPDLLTNGTDALSSDSGSIADTDVPYLSDYDDWGEENLQEILIEGGSTGQSQDEGGDISDGDSSEGGDISDGDSSAGIV